MKILSIASRNVFRNWRRTLVTTLAMGFAGFIMILFAALMAGLLQTSERNAVSMNLGDIQIHAEGYRDDPDLYKRIDDASGMLSRIQRAGFHATKRLYSFGLAAAGSASAGVQLRGIDMINEATVTQIHQHVMEGNWLSDSDPKGVVIGRKMARTLNVRPDDEVIIIGQASDGSMANDLYRVRGILKSVGEDVDRSGFFMPESTFRDLMVLPEGAHEIAVMRPDRSRDLEAAASQVAALAPGYETKNWRELRPAIARILDIADVQIIIMILITYVAVAMIVLNAMLMSVFERIREFGIMKAIGVTPFQLTLLIYAETMVQVVTAGIIALASGWSIAHYLQNNGIDLSSISQGASFGGVAMDPIWCTYVTKEALIYPIAFLFIIAVLAVIYPAIKAAVIQPVKAIHHR
ncbi:MAG: ABC transporter permease [Deltaproteobacteria bacterium]|nr:ABC transporter permease [Deltaproteobacteria bacterium]